MTEYRLVPVEPTPEMLEAARPWPTHWGDRALASNEQKAAYLADHMTVASDYRAMLSAAPPAPTRDEVVQIEALLDGADLVAGHVDHDSDAEIGRRFIGKRHLIRSILSLLGRPE